MKPQRGAFIICLLALSAACGGDSAAPDPALVVDRVIIEPPSFVVEVGESIQLAATPQNANGAVVPGHAAVWTSNDESIATVTTGGIVTGVATGPVTITATAAGKSRVAAGAVQQNMTITASGGTLTSTDGRVSLVFPPGAVSSPVRISMQPSVGLAGHSRLVPGSAFHFGPSGLQFNVPVVVSINYGTLPVTHAGGAAYLWLHKWENDDWVPVPGMSPDTLTNVVRGQLTSFSDYGAALSSLANDLQALSLNINRLLADPIAQHAIAFLGALESLLAEQENALFQALAPVVLNAMSATACNAYKVQVNIARGTIVDSYEELTALLEPVYAWSAISEKLAPNACELPITMLDLHVQMIEQFINFYTLKLDQPDFTADFLKLLAEIDLMKQLRGSAQALGLDALEARIVDDAQIPLLSKLRESAYRVCRDNAVHKHLGALRGRVQQLDYVPYAEHDLLADLQYCATRLDWRLAKSNGITVGEGALGGGSSPGAHTTLASAPGLASGQLELSSDVRAFTCADGSVAADELVIEFHGVEVRRLQPAAGGNFFASPVSLNMAQLVDAAGINTSAAGTYAVDVIRESFGCGGLYVESIDLPVVLARLNLTYPPGPSLPLQIVVSNTLHHLGNDSGSEGANYINGFNVPTAFDSATVSITFVYPNAADKRPEVDAGRPRIFVNDTDLGLSTADFEQFPGCITTNPIREFKCTRTITLPATSAVLVGANTIRVASEVAFGGDDDFVFGDLVVTIWR